MSNNGVLVISLDFELLWGVFDIVGTEEKEKYFENTRQVIPKILEVFSSNEIHATWATVGMLFNHNWEEWEQNVPDSKPSYTTDKFSAYNFVKHRVNSISNIMCFAPEIIKKIQKTSGQEIGSHTYSHYYCQEDGQTIENFKADMEKSLFLAKSFGIDLRSLVFPRNQFNVEYLEVCKELGIKTVRSNPNNWYWRNLTSHGILTRLFRTGDVYNIFGSRKSYAFSDLKRHNSLPLAQKASRFLRPVESNTFLRKLKLIRIKEEMTAAAKKKEIYHLWWHPHNFGKQPSESLRDLQNLVDHYLKLNEKFGFQSLNMEEVERLEFSLNSI